MVHGRIAQEPSSRDDPGRYLLRRTARENGMWVRERRATRGLGVSVGDEVEEASMPQVRIGVDIGSTGVRAAELSMRSMPPQLVRVAQVPVPEGAVSSGEVRDPGLVAGALRELWKRGKFGSHRDVILGVANQR